ncbi:hypothetical protein [Moorena sp. SIO3H5]|nr:hypothetical protein [Moorena sp. SIO3H5]
MQSLMGETPFGGAASLRERQKARGKRQELINYIGIFGNEKKL